MKQPEVCDLSRTAAGNARRLRKDRDWSQTELAAAVGVSRALIAQIEGGRRNLTLSVLERVAKALEVEPADLIGSGRTVRFEVYMPPGLSSEAIAEAAVRNLGLMLA